MVFRTMSRYIGACAMPVPLSTYKFLIWRAKSCLRINGHSLSQVDKLSRFIFTNFHPWTINTPAINGRNTSLEMVVSACAARPDTTLCACVARVAWVRWQGGRWTPREAAREVRQGPEGRKSVGPMDRFARALSLVSGVWTGEWSAQTSLSITR